MLDHYIIAGVKDGCNLHGAFQAQAVSSATRRGGKPAATFNAPVTEGLRGYPLRLDTGKRKSVKLKVTGS